MRVVTETIDPNRASAILAHSEGQLQRALSKSRVQRYVHSIRAGQWMVTHQPIALDTDGVLIDGQHRLHAIVEANIAVTMSVAYDASPDTFAVVDTGGARKTSDALKIAGYTNTNVLAAAARHYMGYTRILGTRYELSNIMKSQISSVDVIEYLESREGENTQFFVNKAGGIATNLGRYGVRSWLAAGLKLIADSGVSDDLLVEFIDKLSYGDMLPATSPILVFRRWILSETGYGKVNSYQRPQAGLMNLIKVYNAWMLDTPVQLLRNRVGLEATVRPVPRRMNEAELEQFEAETELEPTLL